jgi:hypothetical protein
MKTDFTGDVVSVGDETYSNSEADNYTSSIFKEDDRCPCSAKLCEIGHPTCFDRDNHWLRVHAAWWL